MLQDASVDMVYSTIVFKHLEGWNRYTYVCEAFRVLRPGGRLMVDNINLPGEAGFAYFDQLRQTFVPDARPPGISKTSTPRELARYFERTDFVNSQLREQDIGLLTMTWGRKPHRSHAWCWRRESCSAVRRGFSWSDLDLHRSLIAGSTIPVGRAGEHGAFGGECSGSGRYLRRSNPLMRGTRITQS